MEQLTKVYSYALRGDLPQEAMDQMFLGHRLKNKLVEVWKAHEEDRKQVDLQFANLAAAEAEVEAAQESLSGMRALAKQERVENQSTKPSPITKAQLSEASARVKDAKERRKAERLAAGEARKTALSEAKDRYFQAIKEARQEAAAGGLYWGTYNRIIDHHKVSDKLVVGKRTKGQAADMRFQRWTGEGILYVQIQKQPGVDRRPEAFAREVGRHANVLRLTPNMHPDDFDARSQSERRKIARSASISFTIGSKREIVTMPIILHRMMPVDCEVAGVEIVRRLHGRGYKLFANFTVIERAPMPRPSGSTIGVDFGWKGAGGTGINVASVVATGVELPAEIPQDIAVAVKKGEDPDHEALIFLPPDIPLMLDRCSGIRSIRDEMFDVFKEDVASALAENQEAQDALEVTPADIRRWRSQGRMKALLRKAREAGVELPTLYTDKRHGTVVWESLENHLYDYEYHERAQVLARKTDTWRKVAEWLTRSGGTLYTTGIDIGKLKQRPGVEQEDEHAARGGRVNIQRSSPGELRSILTQKAISRGMAVISENPTGKEANDSNT